MATNNQSQFRAEFTLARRKEESSRMREKHPDRIPVIVEKRDKSTLPNIDKRKFLVPYDLTFCQFIHVIRKRLRVEKDQALFTFIDDNKLPPVGQMMSAIFEDSKNEDGFLYVTYTGENVFGV